MRILGLQRLTLLDYPGRLACTVFLGGCNMRCPFCHNGDIVLGSGDEISEQEFFAFLASRIGRLEGVCISGGEPTIQSDLPELLTKIKSMGFLVKLDTNGTRPEVIRELIARGLVDYIAMDVKNAPEKYAKTAGLSSFNFSAVAESIKIISLSGLDHEFRTTVTAELHTAEDIRAIAEWLSGAEKYYLQRYRDEGDILARGLTAPTAEEMERLLAAAREFVPTAEAR